MPEFVDEYDEPFDEGFQISNASTLVYDEDSWATKLRLKLEHALGICIASAYVDMRGVEMLKKVLDSVPPDSTREIRLLLDERFHENELAREAIINNLYDLPNVQIRLADTSGKFHAKCYIFNQGAYTSCLVGSLNLTGAALTRNVEYALFSDDSTDVQQCQGFFNRYWNSARQAPKTLRKDYPEMRFRLGQMVISKETGDVGCIREIQADSGHERFLYQVFFDASSKAWMNEDELEGYPIYDIPLLPSDGLASAVFEEDAFQDFLSTYLFNRYGLPALEGYYSSYTSRIEKVWYQRIPLLKILASPRPRLLIADEVGLGKTIEAGLIIKELIGRMAGVRKILVLCPNNLTEKWQAEMGTRFGLYFDVCTGKEAVAVLKSLSRERGAKTYTCIIPYSSLNRKELIKIASKIRAPLDIVVCDEAHHLRNANNTQKIVRNLVYNNRCMLMLTATPINLSNKDLHTLLGILDPQKYRAIDQDGWNSLIVPNVYISRLYATIADCFEKESDEKVSFSEEVREKNSALQDRILRSALYGPAFPEDHPLVEVSNNIERHFQEGNNPMDIVEARTIAERILESNVLSQSITRTLKKDVLEDFTVRNVRTIKVKLIHEEEKERFNTYLKRIREFAKGNPQKRLAAHTLLRQASSCLPAMPALEEASKPGFENKYDASSLSTKTLKLNEPSISQAIPDSKYDALKQVILEAKAEEEDYKVLIFCVFLNTIAYLKTRLNFDFGEGSVALVTGEVVEIEDRYQHIREFLEDGKPNILICSEIASEGIDLQECHILVNYDLPWNPTVVEQRIGRIDRFGQKAEVINIFNIVVDGTVEEIIYSRLDKRLEDARNTLGPVAEILGKMEKELPDEFLKTNFSDDERKAYEKQIDTNLRYARREQEKIEQETLRLTSMRDAYRKEIISDPGQGVDHFEKIGRYLLETNTDLLESSEVDGRHFFSLRERHRDQLIRELGKYLIARNNDKAYRHLKRVLQQEKLPVVFTQEEAVRRPEAEFLTVDHPLAQFLMLRNRRHQGADQVANIRTTNTEVPQGLYLVVEYVCEIQIGSRVYDYQFHTSAFKISRASCSRIEDTDLKGRLFDFEHWEPGRLLDVDSEVLGGVERQSREEAQAYYSDKYEGIKARLIDDIENQKNAYSELQLNEERQLIGRIEATVDPNETKRLELELIKLRDQVDEKIADLPNTKDILLAPSLLLFAAIERE